MRRSVLAARGMPISMASSKLRSERALSSLTLATECIACSSARETLWEPDAGAWTRTRRAGLGTGGAQGSTAAGHGGLRLDPCATVPLRSPTTQRSALPSHRFHGGLVRSLALVSTIAALLCAAIDANAIPRYTARVRQNCTLCHANPTGGGMRSLYASQFLVP